MLQRLIVTSFYNNILLAQNKVLNSKTSNNIKTTLERCPDYYEPYFPLVSFKHAYEHYSGLLYQNNI